MNPTGTWLFNPFVRVAGLKSLIWGVAALLCAGIIAAFATTHFDGVLDTHNGLPAPFWLFLAEGFIDWSCLAVVLLLAGRIISQTSFRTIDLIGTQALARWPTLIVAALSLTRGFQRFGHAIQQAVLAGKTPDFSSPDGILFCIVSVLMIPLLIWMILLMYRSFSVSCNVKGAKGIITFIVGLIAAEILSKCILVPLFHHIL